MTMLREITPHQGRPKKFTPANLQKIKDWVAKGISREEIARSIGATVGSLQVTCSRMGISLRKPKELISAVDNNSKGAIPNHPPMLGHVGPQFPRVQFQLVIERDGKRCVTDVPLTGTDIARLGLEAALQNLTVTQLLAQAVTTAIKNDLIEEILRKPAPASP